jgi:hypothetical protein
MAIHTSVTQALPHALGRFWFLPPVLLRCSGRTMPMVTCGRSTGRYPSYLPCFCFCFCLLFLLLFSFCFYLRFRFLFCRGSNDDGCDDVASFELASLIVPHQFLISYYSYSISLIPLSLFPFPFLLCEEPTTVVPGGRIRVTFPSNIFFHSFIHQNESRRHLRTFRLIALFCPS